MVVLVVFKQFRLGERVEEQVHYCKGLFYEELRIFVQLALLFKVAGTLKHFEYLRFVRNAEYEFVLNYDLLLPLLPNLPLALFLLIGRLDEFFEQDQT